MKLTDSYQSVDFTNVYPKTPQNEIRKLLKHLSPRPLRKKSSHNQQPTKLYNIRERQNSICFQKYINQAILVDRTSQCPTELLASYLDKVTTPFVRGLDSYVKDAGHMLIILDSFRFWGEHRLIFTMDIKSLYTVIPYDEGLKYFLDKREVLDPPTHTHTTPCV